MMRILAATGLLAATFSLAGCGGSSASYTEKALAEFASGGGADHYESSKRPTQNQVAAFRSSAKTFKPGSKDDFYQGFMILNNNRDHSEVVRNALAKGRFVRSVYNRVFGKPSEVQQTKNKTQTWVHHCTDGKVKLSGILKAEGEYMLVDAPKR